MDAEERAVTEWLVHPSTWGMLGLEIPRKLIVHADEVMK